MKINIYAKGITLTESEKEYIETKVTKLSNLAKRVQDEASEIRVDIVYADTKSKNDAFTCAMTFFLPHQGETLRGEENGMKIHEAVDKTQAIMVAQIEKYKERFSRK
jgi:ribosomal subunit interface protein